MKSNALDRECWASVDSPSIAVSEPAASTPTSIQPASAGPAHGTRVANGRAHKSRRRCPRRGPRDGPLLGDLGCLQGNRPRRESAVERHLALPVALHRSSLELHESPVVDPYTSWVGVNEVCELSSPSICGSLSFAEARLRRPVQPTCNTVVVAATIKTTWRTTDVRATPSTSAGTKGHSQRGMCSGWCCTLVARGAYEAADRRGERGAT